ncbi:hypothetical protein CAPTEDRAFT_188527 [Capitella teleta]|uniref:Ectopic P granules protein 5 homolog n=1 Tax=Capitella teleta TaxID=283909 RepID=R7U0N3_CAPTE|nr:hypothetical protein CAPTEDRAFT_188527 [Capitella teleta]|eukprot:ELT99412.1 hypothetical protein CAPTEDRAFT_188527 [Capitella teleta]
MAEAVKIKTKNRTAKTSAAEAAAAENCVTDEDILKAVAELPEIKAEVEAVCDQDSVANDQTEKVTETKTANEDAVTDCDGVEGETHEEEEEEEEGKGELNPEAVSSELSMVTASEGSPVGTSETITGDIMEDKNVLEDHPETCVDESSAICQSTSQTGTEEHEVFHDHAEASCPEAEAEQSDLVATAPQSSLCGIVEKEQDERQDISILAAEQSAEIDDNLIKKSGGLYPDLDSLAMACSSAKQEDEPFTIEQLRSLYCNHQLEHQEEFVDIFLVEMNRERDEFYEILQSYLRARNNLCSAEHDIRVLVKECNRQEELVWQTTTEAMVLQGQCQDKAKVTADHSYEVVTYSEEANKELSESLKRIRCHIHDELSLAAYEAQLSRLKVESYLYELFLDNPSLRNFPRNAPVIAHLAHQLNRRVSQQVSALKHCISVLFAFQRKPAKDPVFVSDTQKWLSILVGTLLRTATLEDHIFILQHLLRCPPGVCKWGTSLLQVLPPAEGNSMSSWGSPLLDHTLTVLASLMKPVRKREDVLYQLKVTLTPPPDKIPENPWILVDSEGEEDEDPHNSWWLLLENDVVAFLQQIPLQEVFAHVLFITHTDEGRLLYNIERTSEAGFLKLIAFASYFLDILGEGLQTYSQVRYRQLNKRIGRMISHTVHYIADHWENFHQVYAEALADSSVLKRLHIEIDALFHRAVMHILSAQRLGSWQFLTDLPYWCISLDMMWRLLWLMHQGHHLTSGDPSQGQTSKDNKASDYCRKLLEDVDTQHWFETKLTRMPISEVTFLLTTFANMARSRPLQDLHFIESVTCEIFEVSIYLFKELPVHLWTPREGDLAIIREWLLDQPQSSPHNQLGRLVLEKLNWSYKHKTQELFLDLALHTEVAVLIVETYMQHLAGKAISGIFTEGLGKASSPASEDLQLASWAWHLALRLCLHSSKRPMCPLPIADVQGNPKLQPIQQGFKEHYALAVYIALVMGKQSHNAGDFCAEGVRMLALLADKFHYVAVVRALSHLTPLFFTNVDILTSNKEFMQILHNLLSADANRKSYFSWEFPGPITRLCCQMIIGELSVGLQLLPPCDVSVALLAWLSLLVNLPNWNKDKNVLYLIDKAMQPSEREAGVFASLASWLTPSPTSPTLIDSPSCPEFPWFAYAALNAETLLEDESGLWSHLQRNLAQSSTTTIDVALKRAASTLKLEGMGNQAFRLCVYRWAQQALETPEKHPLLPLLWQRFFLLYLGRQTCEEQGMPQRGSVGERFFDSVSYNSLMKRMKKRLSDTASHFHRLASSTDDELQDSRPSQYDSRPSAAGDSGNAHLHILVKYFQTLSFWLDEPRLHDETLYLPALPSQYESDRLLTVFNKDMTPWREFVDMRAITRELDELREEWRAHSSHDLQAEHWNDAHLEDGSLNATERILKRIQEQEPRVPPPTFEDIQAPLTFLDDSILCHQQNLLHTLRSDFYSLVDFSKLYCMRVSRHVGLDMSAVEYYPDLFKNEMTEATIHAHCKSSFNPLHKCKGPAIISVRYEAKARNNIISRKLDENRVEYKQLMIEAQLPPPQNLCAAAVHVENTIKRLIGLLDSALQTQNVVREVGTALFYQIAGYVTEDTKYYPPTQQFFAACIEVLGQNFIHNNPTQSQPLLAAVLQMPALVSLLAPNFSPNASPELFTTMYQDMLRVPQNQGPEVAFTLLTKFDVNQWLSVSQPEFSERSHFVATLSEALYMCGSEPNEALSMVFQIYRLHLQQTLQYRFPDHFGEILKLLVKDQRTLSLIAINVTLFTVLDNRLQSSTRVSPLAFTMLG